MKPFTSPKENTIVIHSLFDNCRGCGEQNMMNMSMTVMVARYLTPNDHWSLVADYHAEDRAREIISSGMKIW